MYQKKCFLQHFMGIYYVYLIFHDNDKGGYAAYEISSKVLNNNTLNLKIKHFYRLVILG